MFPNSYFPSPAGAGGGAMPTPDEVLLGVAVGDSVGTVRLPAQSQVELNVVYGPNDILVGGLDPGVSGDQAQPNDVRFGVVYNNATLTGNLVVPVPDTVLVGTVYDGIGTPQTGNRTDAPEADVRLGVTYGANGISLTGQWTGGTGTPGAAEWIEK